MAELHINSGLVRLDIIRDGENVGVFKFNPKDVGEAQRFGNVVAEMEAKREEYTKKASEADTSDNAKARVDFMVEFIKFLRNSIDGIYGDGTSELVFGKTLDVDMFFEFMQGIAPYYKNASTERTAKYKNKASKKS